MKFPVLKLNEPIVIPGQPVFSPFPARVQLSQPEGYDPLSWILLSPEEDIPITVDSVTTCHPQNLAVRGASGTHAHVLEHFLPLKIAGLLGLELSSTHCLPYSGSMQPFLDIVLKNSTVQEMDVPVMAVKQPCQWTYPEPRAGHEGFTRIEPRYDGRLVLDITIDYPGLRNLERGYVGPTHLQRHYDFPDLELLKKVAKARAPGWPLHRYWPSVITSRCRLWSHHDKVAWPQKLGIAATLDEFMDHRCLDALGAISLLCNGCQFSGTIISKYSGHYGDLAACRKACAIGLESIDIHSRSAA